MAQLHRKYKVRFDLKIGTNGNFFAYVYDPVSTDKKFFDLETRNKREANERLAQFLDSVFGQNRTLTDVKKKYKPETLENVLEAYLSGHYTTKTMQKPNQAELIRKKNVQINRICKWFGSDSPTSLNRVKIQNMIDERLKDGQQASSIKGDIECIFAALRKVKGHAIAAPIVGAMKGYTLPPCNEKTDFLDPEDFKTLASFMHPLIKLICEIQFVTGARISEISAAKWSHFNSKTCSIDYKAHEVKEGKAKSIVIGSKFAAMLEDKLKNARRKKDGSLLCEYIFTNRYGTNKLETKSFYRYWELACLNARGKFVKIDDKGRERAAFTSHTLRRSRITLQVEAGVNFSTIAANTGHSPNGVFARYVKTNGARVQEMVENISKTDNEYLERIKKIEENKVKSRLEALWSVEEDEDKKKELWSIINTL